MTTVVQSAIESYLVNSNNKRRESRKKVLKNRNKEHLWASDVGGCHRAAFLRINGGAETVLPDARLLNYMKFGVVIEDETAASLVATYDNVETQLALKNDIWSGRPDFVIDHGTNNPIVIEHKVTGEKGWWRKELPRVKHLGQLGLYGYLYEQLFGIEPRLILFYRGWGHYAELECFLNENSITVTGIVDNEAYLQEIDYAVLKEIALLEEEYKANENGAELPKKLRYKKDGCTFFGKPSCRMYYHCFDK